MPSLEHNLRDLTRLLRSNHKPVKLAALRVFQEAELVGVRDKLAELVTKEKLGQLNDCSAGVFLALLEDEHFEVRQLAIQCILRMKGLISLTSLKSLIFFMVNDEYSQVRL